MSAASRNPELAKVFLTFLLSEKTQSIDSSSGFPINQKAFDQCPYFNVDYYKGIQVTDGFTNNKYFDNPTQEQLDDQKKLIHGVDKTLHYNDKVRRIMRDTFNEFDFLYDMEDIKRILNSRLKMQAEE